MSFSRLDVLRHVLDEIRFVEARMAELSEDDFMHDGTLQLLLYAASKLSAKP